MLERDDSAASCPARVALIDDNLGELRLFELALKKHMRGTEVVLALGPDQAWQLVRAEGAFANVGPISLLLLDLRVGHEDGLELVRHVRTRGSMPHVPIVILSGSQDPRDVERSYRAGVNAFVRKQNDLDGIHEVFEAVAAFWCKAAALPSAA